jgi:predicted dehydrogenase
MYNLQLYNRKALVTRREFVGQISYYGLTGIFFSSLSALTCNNPNNHAANEKVDEQSGEKKLGIALVGLGQYSSGQLAPALEKTEHCYLAGIVTGTPGKIDKWKSKYRIPDGNVYNYENFDTIRDNSAIDIIYVVLPNAMHAEYVIRAAKAGKHVICEKPMATTVDDCDKMIAACQDAGKLLSIGYRLHFEPHNIEMMRLGQEKVFGSIQKLKAENGMNGTGGWRLDKELAGGGPLMDMGIYCVQAARYTTGMEPVAVRAQEGPKTNLQMFTEVEESLNWQMEFPGNIVAECKTSYSESMSLLRAESEKGWFEISPAYSYGGIKGETSEGKMQFEEVAQQALQMDDFAQAIKSKRATPVPGEMGKQDVKILQSIYQAMKTGERVEII